MQNSFFGNTYNVWLGPPEGLLMNRVIFLIIVILLHRLHLKDIIIRLYQRKLNLVKRKKN